MSQQIKKYSIVIAMSLSISSFNTLHLTAVIPHGLSLQDASNITTTNLILKKSWKKSCIININFSLCNGYILLNRCQQVSSPLHKTRVCHIDTKNKLTSPRTTWIWCSFISKERFSLPQYCSQDQDTTTCLFPSLRQSV